MSPPLPPDKDSPIQLDSISVTALFLPVHGVPSKTDYLAMFFHFLIFYFFIQDHLLTHAFDDKISFNNTVNDSNEHMNECFVEG